MKLGDSKGIKTGVWTANEILHADDINYVGEATYANITDQLALKASQQSVDEVVSGLTLEPKTLLTTTLKAGAAVSFSGSYLTDNVWGFSADPGAVFSIILPEDEEIGFSTADPTDPRIDVVEIRPIQTAYNLKARQYKDPITGLVTASPTNTRYEYGCEVQVLEGTAVSTPSAESSTAGWIKLAEVYVEAAATEIFQGDIKTTYASSIWNEEADTTLNSNPLGQDLAVSIPATYNLRQVHTQFNNYPSHLGGHLLQFQFGAGAHSWEAGDVIVSFAGGEVELVGVSSPTINVPTGNSLLQITVLNGKLTIDDFTSITGIEIKLYGDTSSTLTLSNFTYRPGSFAGSSPILIFNWIKVSTDSLDWYDDVGGVDALVAYYFSNCTLIDSIPGMSSTVAYQAQYHVLLIGCMVQDSSNLINGTVGDIHPSSSNYTLLDKLNFRGVVTSDITMVSNNKYLVNGDYELTLPDSPVEGDDIGIISNGFVKIIQNDSNHSIIFKNGKYFTTKGITGLVNMYPGDLAELTYKGDGLSPVDPIVELTNLTTLPTGWANDVAITYDGVYLGMALNATPWVNFYKRTAGTDTWVKLSNPSTLPGAQATGCAFSADGTFFALSLSGSPYIVIYKRTAGTDTWVKLSNPALLPAGSSNNCVFTQDGKYLAIAHATSPYVTVYSISGDTFTRLSALTAAGTGNGMDIAFSYDGNYLAVSNAATPYIAVYNRQGDTFVKLTALSAAAGIGWSCAFSPDGNYLAVGHDTTPFITIYKRTGNTFVKLPNVKTPPAGAGASCKFSPNGNYLAVSHYTTPFITWYKREGDTFTKLTNPVTLPPSTGLGTAFSGDGNYNAVATDTTPFVTIYKTKETVTKQWLLRNYETMNPDNKDAEGDARYRFK